MSATYVSQVTSYIYDHYAQSLCLTNQILLPTPLYIRYINYMDYDYIITFHLNILETSHKLGSEATNMEELDIHPGIIPQEGKYIAIYVCTYSYIYPN